jgi:hypothetical protein
MKRQSWLTPTVVASFAALLVLPAAYAGLRVALGGGLNALAPGLPSAKSGETYLWKLRVEGGTPPYKCTPVSLGIGSLHLSTNCTITGTAPVVKSRSPSITGPFLFKVTDSSKPPKTAEFPTTNFSTVPEKTAPFDGTYKVTDTGTTTTTCPDGPPLTVGPSSFTSNITVANGMFMGAAISKDGELTIHLTTAGITTIEHFTFTGGVGDRVTVTGIDSSSGSPAGCEYVGHGTDTGSRVSVPK